MIKLSSSIRSGAIAVAVILLSSIIFLSCKKDNNDNNNIPVAGLMAFNLSPDKSSVGFALSGSNLTNAPLAYTNYTGAYLGIYPGAREVQSYDFNSAGTIASAPGTFEADKYYSVFLLGAAGNYKNIVVNDNVDTLAGSSGQAFIRYVNAIPDSVSAPTVTITANGSNVINDPAPFTTVSNFVPVSAGSVSIAVKNSSNIDVSRTITVEEKKVYTVLLVGIPGSATTPAEIKFIGNGTLDDASRRTSSANRAASIN